MVIYVRCFRLFALSIELTKEYTLRPFLRNNTCNGEIIIDIPYTRVIFTPQHILNKASKRRARQDDVKQGINSPITTIKRASENRF